MSDEHAERVNQEEDGEVDDDDGWLIPGINTADLDITETEDEQDDQYGDENGSDRILTNRPLLSIHTTLEDRWSIGDGRIERSIAALPECVDVALTAMAMS